MSFYEGVQELTRGICGVYAVLSYIVFSDRMLLVHGPPVLYKHKGSRHSLPSKKAKNLETTSQSPGF